MSLLQTPAKKQQEQDIPETAIKEEGEEYASEIKEKEVNEVEDLKETLDHVEKQIKEIEDRLKVIEVQKKKVKVDSDDYQNLDDQVRVLKKELIDLDFQHQTTHNKFKQAQKQANQAKKTQEHHQEQPKQVKQTNIGQKELSLPRTAYTSRARLSQLELSSISLRRSRLIQADLIAIKSLETYYLSSIRIQAQADLIAIKSLETYYLSRHYDYPYYSYLYRQPLIYSRHLDPLYLDSLCYTYTYPLYSDHIYPRYPYLRYI